MLASDRCPTKRIFADTRGVECLDVSAVDVEGQAPAVHRQFRVDAKPRFGAGARSRISRLGTCGIPKPCIAVGRTGLAWTLLDVDLFTFDREIRELYQVDRMQ